MNGWSPGEISTLRILPEPSKKSEFPWHPMIKETQLELADNAPIEPI